MVVKTKNDLRIPFGWEERRPILLERFFYMPKAYAHETAERISWFGSSVFDLEQPIFLELCSGNGQWIGERAREFPAANWVAVELQFERARKVWCKLFREEIPNLFVVCGEAGAFLRHYAPLQSVAQVFINFPDPWPKLRHAKHRLIQAPFLRALHQVLQPRGIVTLATDDAAYRDQMVREFEKSACFEPVFNAPYFRTDWIGYGNSYFGNLWKDKGRTIFYLQYAGYEIL